MTFSKSFKKYTYTNFRFFSNLSDHTFSVSFGAPSSLYGLSKLEAFQAGSLAAPHHTLTTHAILHGYPTNSHLQVRARLLWATYAYTRPAILRLYQTQVPKTQPTIFPLKSGLTSMFPVPRKGSIIHPDVQSQHRSQPHLLPCNIQSVSLAEFPS